MRSIPLLFIFVTLLSLGCAKDEPVNADGSSDGGDGTDGADGSDGSTDGGCSEDADCDPWQICEEGSCEAGDRNNSVEEAQSLLWEDSREGRIMPAGDVDYFSFEADGGEYVRISTTLEDAVIEAGGDTVLILRDESGKLVTSANRFATGTAITGVDAVAFAYLAEAGTYTITVEDDGTNGADPDGVETGFSDYVYTVALQEWGATTFEPDSAESPQYTIDLDTSRIWSTVGALLESDGDVDYIGLEVRGIVGGELLFVDGNQDMEGSDLRSRIRLLDSSGRAYTDKLDVGPSDYALVPFVEPGSYVLEISDIAGTGGDKHWTFLHVISRPDDWNGSEFQQEVEGNDLLSTAETLVQTDGETSSGNLYTFSSVYGRADSTDDEDWYSFNAGYGGNFFGFCLNSASLGGGVSPQVDLYDGSGALVQTWTGTSANPNLYVANESLADGDWFVRVSPTDGTGGGPGDWYAFTLYVASFEAGSYGCPNG
jgi:hypothetical protein